LEWVCQQQRLKDLPAVVMSSFEESGESKSAKALGAVAYYVKTQDAVKAWSLVISRLSVAAGS
jgi:hypothetical protein